MPLNAEFIKSLPTYEKTGPTYAPKGKDQSPEALQNNFLKLLTAQLQYQDPMKPMENAEFTSQMAQFSMIEQQQQGNGLLEKLLSSQSANAMDNAVGYIGRDVMVEGKGMEMAGGQGAIHFQLPSAAEVGVTLFDSQGIAVKTIDPASFVAGENSVQIQDLALADGHYTFKLNAQTKDGKVVDAIGLEHAMVKGVTRDAAGARLDLGGRSVPMTDLWRVDGNSAATTAASAATV